MESPADFGTGAHLCLDCRRHSRRQRDFTGLSTWEQTVSEQNPFAGRVFVFRRRHVPVASKAPPGVKFDKRIEDGILFCHFFLDNVSRLL